MQAKQQEWCFRLDQELKNSDNSFFVTFTYEDEELIWLDDEPVLYKRHMQLFFKSLRKWFRYDKIKYYCVGEYGEQWRPLTPKGRPHFHALIFYRGRTDWFKVMLKIKEYWPHGIAQVLPVQGAQGYVTKYILKFDRREHKVPPFSLISHGLGIDYLTKSMVKYHHDNLISYAIKPGGYRVNLPRYYKDKIFSPYEKLVLKKRSDMYRKQLDLVRLDNIDLQLLNGRNPFREQVNNYQVRLYNSMKLYRQKKRL